MGIIFACAALLLWGFAEFFIQKSARKFGDWIALFYICTIGSIGILPFIWHSLPETFADPRALIVLTIAGVVMLIAALFAFEALRVGKISVIEPIYALEVPIAGLLAGSLLAEIVSPAQTILVLLMVISLGLVAAKDLHHFRGLKWERGIAFAVAGTVGMGATNFLVAWGGRETDALTINWFIDTLIGIACLAYILAKKRGHEIVQDWKKSWKLILAVSIFDNLAWIAFAASATYIPITVATAFSESYIALAALLGIMFNREKLKRHQKIGLVLAVITAVALAFVTPE